MLHRETGNIHQGKNHAISNRLSSQFIQDVQDTHLQRHNLCSQNRLCTYCSIFPYKETVSSKHSAISLYTVCIQLRMDQPVSNQHILFCNNPQYSYYSGKYQYTSSASFIFYANYSKRSPGSEFNTEGTSEIEPETWFLAMIQKPYHAPISGIGGKRSYCCSSYWSPAFIGHIHSAAKEATALAQPQRFWQKKERYFLTLYSIALHSRIGHTLNDRNSVWERCTDCSAWLLLYFNT